jgi:hypothetical protein
MSQTKAIINKLLTNVSNGIFPVGYVADKVLPELVVKQKSGIIGAYGNGHLRLSDDLMGGEAAALRANPISRSISQTYLVETHGLEGVVTADDYNNVEQPFDAEADEVAGLTHMVLTNKERKFATSLFNTTTFSGRTTTPGTKYGTGGSDPLADFKTAQNAIVDSVGVQPNAAIMSQKVLNILKYHASLLDVLGFKYNQMGTLSLGDIATALNVEEIIVANAPYNSAKDGQADSIAQIWSDSILFYVRPKAAAKYQVSLGYSMKLSGMNGNQVYKYDLNNPPGSQGIIVQQAYQPLIVNASAGYLLNAVL